MGNFDRWDQPDEEEEELYDSTAHEARRDVILFCIDCSKTMLHPYDDPLYENVLSCHVQTALEAAAQIQKRKVFVGPSDSVGILLYNVEKKNQDSHSTNIKSGTYLYQSISQISADKVIDLNRLIEEARSKPEHLRELFPSREKKIPMGDVFTSCLWVMRDGAPKAASKRIFLVTDDDNPNSGPNHERLLITARTTLRDLSQSGIQVEPFFISTDDVPFDRAKFWTSVLLPITTEEYADSSSDDVLPESMSISRIDDLLDQMRFFEVPKRAYFNLPFMLMEGFVIGVKGYNLITQATKSTHKYFYDMGDRMEVAQSRSHYVDEALDEDVDKEGMLFGVSLGAAADDEDAAKHGFGARAVNQGARVFFTAEEIKSFRTLGLSPGLKLLGFKKRNELRFEDNVKHSIFVHPNEATYSGSKRTFSALIQTMLKKKRIALLLGVVRSNASPTFYAALPQAEIFENGSYTEPAGLHLIPLPFADDIREATYHTGSTACDELVQSVRPIVKKLELKGKAYLPESYPNPALALHNAQLEASAFREEYDPADFKDVSLPRYDMIHKKIGPFIGKFKALLKEDRAANTVIADESSKSKRKADVSVDEAEIRSRYESGGLAKLRVDQLKDFLRNKGENVSGKKAELLERAATWLEVHPE